MDNNASVYDMLNQDAEFARQVSEIRHSAASVLKAVEDLKQTGIVQQKVSEQLTEKTTELQNLINRAEGQLNELREERKALQDDITRHETILEEMQRLEESFNGAVNAYGNISAVLEFIKNSGVISTQPSAIPAASAPVEPARPFIPFKNVDYDEVTTIENLLKKYSGKIEGPVIVIRRGQYSWSADYCMAIKNVSKGNAWGIRYQYGKPSGKKPAKATEPDYAMYAGSHYWEIVKDFEEQNKGK